jgi:hypothetical protein
MKKKFGISNRKVSDARNSFLFAALTSLIIGVFSYFLFRDSDLLIFNWLRIHPLKLTNRNGLFNNEVPYIIKYNIADGLWFLSGVLFIRAIWITDRKICKVYMFCFYAIAAFLEILQLTNYIPGTFDMADILICVTIALLEQCIDKLYGENQL